MTTSPLWCASAVALLCVGRVMALSDVPASAAFPGQTVMTGLATEATVADMNGDGIVDVLVTGSFISESSVVKVHLGIGDGTFSAPLATPVASSPQAIATGDMNGDGVLDAVVSYWLGEAVAVHLGNGDGTLMSGLPLALPSRVQDVAVGDLDEDGVLDVAATLPLVDQVAILRGQGDGSLSVLAFLPSVNSQFSAFVFVSDVTGDGHLDVLVNRASLTIGGDLFPGLGDGTFAAPISLGLTVQQALGQVTDMDGDGLADLLIMDFATQSIRIRKSLGGGGFAADVIVPCGMLPKLLQAADFNADGRLDLVATAADSAAARVMLALTSGGFAAPALLPVSTTPMGLEVADFTEDGRPDVLTAGSAPVDNDEWLVVRPGLGDGSFDAPSPVGSQIIAASQLALADLDGDGRLDVVLADPAQGEIDVLLQQPAGSSIPSSDPPEAPVMAAPVPTGVGEKPDQFVAADLEPNGTIDVVTANADSGTITVLRGAGDGTWSSSQDFPAGPSPAGIAVGDVTGDGIADVVVTERFHDQIAVLTGLGSGSFAPPSILPSGGHIPIHVAIVDLDADGWPDVIVQHANTDDITVRYGKPGGGLEAHGQVYLTTTGQGQLLVADVTDDGLPDVLVDETLGNNIAWLLVNTGNRTFAAKTPLGVELSLPIVTRFAVGDLDADGLTDIAVVSGGDRVSILTHDSPSQPFTTAAAYALSGGTTAFGLGDLDGDGGTDIVAAGGSLGTLTPLLNRADRPWCDLGHGLAGTHPSPRLSGTGTLLGGDAVQLDVTEALASAPAILIVGFSQVVLPFKGGVLVPTPNVLFPGLLTGAGGAIHLAATWPGGVPAGAEIFLQTWILDAGGPHGFSATNALRARTP